GVRRGLAGVDGALPDVFGRLRHGVLERPALDGAAPEILVDRVQRPGAGAHREPPGLPVGSGLLAGPAPVADGSQHLEVGSQYPSLGQRFPPPVCSCLVSRPAIWRSRSSTVRAGTPCRQTTRIVSSPARVPAMPSTPVRSIAEATMPAKPGGVWTTTMLPDASGPPTDSRSSRP